jgi:hypothetical protein
MINRANFRNMYASLQQLQVKALLGITDTPEDSRPQPSPLWQSNPVMRLNASVSPAYMFWPGSLVGMFSS